MDGVSGGGGDWGYSNSAWKKKNIFLLYIGRVRLPSKIVSAESSNIISEPEREGWTAR